MATYSKKSKSMTAIVIAIIVVIAAIGFVVYDEWSSHSKVFENEKFATAVAEVLDVTPASLSEESLSDVKFLEAYYDAESKKLTVTATKNFDTKLFLDLNEQLEALDAEYQELSSDEENDHTAELTALSLEANGLVTQLNELSESVMTVTVDADELPNLDDVKYFKSVEILSLVGVGLTDSSVFEGMNKLVNLSVQSCGLTEVNGLTGLDAATVREVSISESGVTDWSALNYIEDKVTIPNYIDFGNGQVFQYGTTTLADYNASLEEAEKETETEETEAEVEDEASGETEEVEVDTEEGTEADAADETETVTDETVETETTEETEVAETETEEVTE